MKEYVRFKTENSVSYGLIDGDQIKELSGQYPDEFQETGKTYCRAEAQLVAPVNPRKIVGLGLNYSDIVLKEGESLPTYPKLFFKNPQAIIVNGDNIEKPEASSYLTAECEIGVVIGKTAKDVKAEDAMDYVFGYIAANDFTASDLQKIDGVWGRAKNFDTFCPVSDRIVCGIDPFHLNLKAYKNGELAIDGNVDKMIQDIPHIIEIVSGVTTLLPGDFILTGVPTGYGVETRVGDTVRIEVENVGSVENKFVAKQK